MKTRDWSLLTMSFSTLSSTMIQSSLVLEVISSQLTLTE
jgi:hypothetical protein